VKCLVAPDVPKQCRLARTDHGKRAGGLRAHARRPWPVAARHTVGQMLPDVVFGCLHQVIKGGVPGRRCVVVMESTDFRRGSLVDEVEERHPTPIRCRNSPP